MAQQPTARAALAFSFAAKYGSLGLRTAGLLVTARLLPPEEFGIFATAASLIALVFVFVEFGLHSYLVQVPRLTRAAVAATVGLSSVLVAAAFAVVGLLALWLPWVRAAPEAGTVLLLLAAATAVQPVTLPVSAKLQRAMRFDRLLVIDLARSVAAVGTGIALVAAGFGVVGLAWGAVADALVGTTLTLALGAGRRPVAPSFRGWGKVARFGGPLAVIGGLRQAADAGTMLLIGGALGSAAAGLYSRALTVRSLLQKAVMEAVSPVVLPVLSREVRRGGDLQRLYLRKIGTLTAIHWPFFLVLALLADPAVRLMLGQQWTAAAPVVVVLCLAGTFDPFNTLSLKFFIALDASAAYLRVQLAVAATRLAAVALLASVSLEAAALGLVAGAAVRAVAVTAWLERRLAVPWAEIGLRLARSAVVAACAALGPALLVLLADGGPPDVPTGLLGAALGALGWAGGLAATRHELGRELLGAASGVRHRLAPRMPAIHPAAWRR